ncbi:hypothetical protein AVEN_73310-1 [Araneus ventricosus]|uniref:Uncharacterized protein n=1 Tax=Araneus ventricosus TaxID=182803 RepID=A0A4Y2SK05_ARAVE|nr:hypothetical protein AVEN_73310-1 [Araneus ventricosus]
MWIKYVFGLHNLRGLTSYYDTNFSQSADQVGFPCFQCPPLRMQNYDCDDFISGLKSFIPVVATIKIKMILLKSVEIRFFLNPGTSGLLFGSGPGDFVPTSSLGGPVSEALTRVSIAMLTTKNVLFLP